MDDQNQTTTPAEDTTQTPVVTSPDITENQGQLMVDMENLIRNHITGIDTLQTEAKKYKEMLDDILAANEPYQELLKKANEASKDKNKQRAEVLKQPHAKELSDKIKELRGEAKEKQEALSDYLQEYQRISGVDEIEGEDGELRKIIYSARLIKALSAAARGK
jgi:phenylalanyl-tRNA synthetase alpha subunit